jgi:hypothetical protein
MRILIKNILCSAVLLSLFTACGGRIAKPTQTTYFQDPLKSCSQLEQELGALQHDIIALEPHLDKSRKNQALMGASLLLIFPLAMMDTTNADKIEYEALRRRYNHLLQTSSKKRCPTERQMLSIDPRFDDTGTNAPKR